MRAGFARRCTSYCTGWSSSKTTVLDSPENECWIPVTREKVDKFFLEAREFGELPAWETAERFAAEPTIDEDKEGAVCESACVCTFSVCTTPLLKRFLLDFHSAPPASTATMAMDSSRTRMSERRVTLFDSSGRAGVRKLSAATRGSGADAPSDST